MSSNAYATLFYGAVVPSDIYKKIYLQRQEDPEIDHDRDEGLYSIVEEAGFSVVAHGNAYAEEMLHGVAIVQHRVGEWFDELVLIPEFAQPTAEQIIALKEFMAKLGVPDAPIGWHLSAYYG